MREIRLKDIMEILSTTNYVIIEDFILENKILWKGFVNNWFGEENDDQLDLQDKAIKFMTVVNGTDELIIMI